MHRSRVGRANDRLFLPPFTTLGDVRLLLLAALIILILTMEISSK